MEKYLDLLPLISVIVAILLLVAWVTALSKAFKTLRSFVGHTHKKVSQLVDSMNNHNYKMAKNFIETLNDKVELTPLEQRQLESARQTIRDFESTYDVAEK